MTGTTTEKLENQYSEAQKKLQLVTTKEHLANRLGVSYGKHLVYYLFRIPEIDRYKQFTISKKNGDDRIISAPSSGLVVVQSRLADILNEIYSPRQGVHGFIKDHSIITNAQQHERRKFVLNIDLEDFFGSINFGRVRGMLMAMPYSLNLGIATLIAQICCYQNKLPKGAPTSPVISNMICADLDSKMKSLAKSNGCYYTRYADDITFSTKTAKFPPELATWRISDGKRQAVVGEKLKDLIEAAGFRVNESKTRLLSKSDRQVVTGLVVNRYVNVPRVYIRNIRAMLHAWQKYDKDLFNAEFLKRNPSASVSQITKIIAGKIQYIGYVRGRTDTVYCALRDRFNELSDDKIPVAPDVWMATLSANLWLIESHDNIQQGTAFYLEGVGLVTCAHCVGVKPFIRHPSKPAKKYDVTVKYIDKFRDVALLECTDASVESKGFKARKSSTDVTLMSEIVLAGYPNFGPGKSMSVKEGKVQSLSKKSGLRRINITANIISGNSGGPVFDRYKRVIGLAVTGAETDLESEETDDHGVIPIYEILNAMKPPVIPSPFETAPEPPLAPGL